MAMWWWLMSKFAGLVDAFVDLAFKVRWGNGWVEEDDESE